MIKILLISSIVLTLLLGAVVVDATGAKANEASVYLFRFDSWLKQIRPPTRAEIQNRNTFTNAPFMDQLQVREQDRLQQHDQDRTRDQIHQVIPVIIKNNWNDYEKMGSMKKVSTCKTGKSMQAMESRK